MASKFRRASTQLKNSTMLTNTKINNICPMEKNLYSASPRGKKTGGTNLKILPRAHAWQLASKCESGVAAPDRVVHRATPPANGSGVSILRPANDRAPAGMTHRPQEGKGEEGARVGVKKGKTAFPACPCLPTRRSCTLPCPATT